MAKRTGTSGNDLSLVGTNRSDTIKGLGGHDGLYGLDRDDILDGGAGNDLLSGGRGNDRLIGGSGDDCFEIYSDSGNDTFVETATGGFDTVFAATTFSLAARQDRANLEAVELQFGYGNIDAMGNARGNVLLGNEGRNVLSGLDGNDSMRGGLGNDTTVGGKGNDHHVIEQAGDKVKELAGEGTDTVYSAFAELRLPLIAHVENATLLGSSNLNLFGNSGQNRLTGNSGANLLNGGGGADSLFGEGGNDTFVWNKNGLKFNGGDGNDTLEVTSGNLNLTGKGGSLFVSTENVHLVGNRTLTITGNDVGAMSPDSQTLTVTSDGGGILLSNDSLTFLGNTTVGDNTFRVYSGEGGIEVHAQTGIDTSNLATFRTPFDGNRGFFVFGAANGDGAGTAVAVGDFNGDGLADIGMGAPFHDASSPNQNHGGIHIIEGRSRDDFSTQVHGQNVVVDPIEGSFNFLGPNAGSQVGTSLVFGDFNANGIDDFFTGGPGGSNPSGIMVFGSGTPAGFLLADIDGDNGVELFPAVTGTQFGAAVGAGDINGDRADDLLITEPGADDGDLTDTGSLLGLFGGIGTTLPDAHGDDGIDTGAIVPGDDGVIISGGVNNAFAGRFLATGDFNNDGRADTVMSFASGGKAGLAIAFGGATGPALTTASDADGTNGVLFFSNMDSTFLGGVRVAAGDVNGDGVDDVIVATNDGVGVAQGRENGEWVLFHKDTGATTADLDFFAFDPTFAGGVSVAAGDVNGDGRAEIIIGTPEANSTGPAGPGGAVKVIDGAHAAELDGATNLSAMLDGFFGFQFLGQAGYRLGVSVTVGDLNGDGFGDVVAGAPGNSSMPGGAAGFWGFDFNAAIDRMGTDNADSLTGGADGEAFVAGLGNDTANGGIFDGTSFRAGAGNDLIISNGNFRVLDGGAGLDIWSPNTSVSLTGAPDNDILSIEQILLNQGDIGLTFDLQNLLEMSRTTNSLTINGAAGDSVTLNNGTWTLTVVDTTNQYTTDALPGWTLGILNNTGMSINVPLAD
jgi:hypothetical protein